MSKGLQAKGPLAIVAATCVTAAACLRRYDGNQSLDGNR
jgi:hypothetical protein